MSGSQKAFNKYWLVSFIIILINSFKTKMGELILYYYLSTFLLRSKFTISFHISQYQDKNASDDMRLY